MHDGTPLAPPPHRLPLGASGIEVSPLAWGMWRLEGRGVAQTARLAHAALDAGITLFDTADIYGAGSPDGFGSCEALLGEVLAAEPGLRARMVIASKGGIRPGVPYDSSAAWLERALDDSLRRLRTDRLELWQIHRPDVLTHPQELARTLERAVASGKVRAIGVSNCTVAQIEALHRFLTVPLATTQPEFSALQLQPLEDGQLDQAMRLGLRVLAWSPLGQGRIAVPGSPPEQAVAAALDAIAAAQSATREAAAYSWIMAHPAGIVPIIGSQRPERLAAAAQALAIRWSRRAWYGVLTAARGQPLP
jgi:predicted oxidoreductase